MISFFVPSQPRPGGSKSVFIIPGTKRFVVTDAGGKPTKEWKSTVAQVAREHFDAPLAGPISVVVYFEMLRPKGHFGTKGNIKASAPEHHVVRPDGTKLWRSTEDALKGIAWKDDSQVISQLVVKRYSERTGAHIFIEEIEPNAFALFNKELVDHSTILNTIKMPKAKAINKRMKAQG